MTQTIASRLLRWHAQHGRTDLPWQVDKTPYRVWLSEIMLQQTQAATVVPYFLRFTERFPTVTALASAPQDDVLHLWTGLGYYARARNLHKAAGIIVREHRGELPDDQAALESLPGIGRSTAAAIRAISYGSQAAILDGNVKRVLARHHRVAGHPSTAATQKVLWQLAEQHTPQADVGTYTQAIMDLGATLCTPRSPGCTQCPISSSCEAWQAGDVDLFPNKKKRKPLPVREAQLVMITDPQGACLLERQPETGVWGGLWSPLVREVETTSAMLAAELGLPQLAGANGEPLNPFRHTFTHYHLDIAPIHYVISEVGAPISESERWLWYAKRDDRPIGLSAPAVKLLGTLWRNTS